MENSLLLRFYSKFTQFDFLSFSPFLSFLTLVTELWAYAAYAHMLKHKINARMPKAWNLILYSKEKEENST